MQARTKKEFIVVALGGILLCSIGLYSSLYARSVVRDDIRKQDITNLKRAIEQYNNAHAFYPTPPSGSSECSKSSPQDWLLGEDSSLLKEHFIDAIPHDTRESKGFAYMYCPTVISKGHTTGFYLQAQFESDQAEGVFFDDDEHRKFGYRILNNNDTKLYRVCGGDDHQCNK